MEVANRIESKLTEALAPSRLEIVDDSASHAGHAGHDGRGESHFHLVIVSDAFEGLSRIERHRRIHELLKDELADRVHALSVRAMTPAEDG